MHLNKIKSICEKDIRKLMLIATLFTTAKKWKQPTYSSDDGWVKKRLSVYTQLMLFSYENE